MWFSDVSLDGKIDGNRHLGHIMLECFRKRTSDDICQIDAAIDEKETYGSVLGRTVAMARSLRRAGFRPGDVMALGGRNHLNLRIPYYAAMMEGLPVGGIDTAFKYEKIKSALGVLRPKIAFCEYEHYEFYSRAAKELGLDTKIITFNEGEFPMAKFMEQSDTQMDEEYRPSCFDTDKVYAWLLCTSGTTGNLKFAALKHGAAVLAVQTLTRLMFGETTFRNLKPDFFRDRRDQNNLGSSGPHQAQDCGRSPVCSQHPLMNIIVLQSSEVTSIDSYIDMINKYKPSKLISSPSVLSLILKHEKHSDLTCLDTVLVGGAKVYREFLRSLKASVHKDAKVIEAYGSSEIAIVIGTNANTPEGSGGASSGVNQFKLVDVTTGAEVTEPYKHGELWAKGPACFTEYYNNPEETVASMTQDGWFKTGDIVYRDEHQNFYFVDRLKMFIQYRNYRLIPPELEEVILNHPGVLEVCVTGVPHPDDGERPAACVVRRPGCGVTAQEIQDLIAETLSETKQLRGGVVFVDCLPKTSTGKVIRPKVQSLAKDLLEGSGVSTRTAEVLTS